MLIFSLIPCGEAAEAEGEGLEGWRCLSTSAAVRTISLSRMGLGISGKKGAMKYVCSRRRGIEAFEGSVAPE